MSKGKGKKRARVARPAPPETPEKPRFEFYCSVCGLRVKADQPPVIFAQASCPRCQATVRLTTPPSGKIVLPPH